MIAPATHSHGCSRHRDGCSACFSDGPTEEQLRQRCLCVFPFRPPVWLIVTRWTLITVNWWPVVLRGSTLNLRPWLLFVFCSLPIQVPLKVWLDTDLILFSRQICSKWIFFLAKLISKWNYQNSITEIFGLFLYQSALFMEQLRIQPYVCIQQICFHKKEEEFLDDAITW